MENQQQVPGAVAPNQQDDRFQEANEPMGTMVRWEEQAGEGAENTIYLGPVVQGIYKNMKTNVGQNSSTIYELELADGQLVSFWGSSLLDGKFAQIEVGMEVRVTYLGVAQPKTAKGRPYRNFRVEYAKPVTSMNEVNPAEAGGQAALVPGAQAPAAQAPVQPQNPVQPQSQVTQAPAADQQPVAGQQVTPAPQQPQTADPGQGF